METKKTTAMTINIKYNIGDILFYMNPLGDVKSGAVKHIMILQYEDKNRLLWAVRSHL